MDDCVEQELNGLIASRIEKLREAKYSYDDLLMVAANCWVLADIRAKSPAQTDISLPLSDVCSKVIPGVVSKAVAATKSHSGAAAINARHDQPGESREKKSELLATWASGQYSKKIFARMNGMKHLEWQSVLLERHYKAPLIPILGQPKMLKNSYLGGTCNG
jgi:hypothetical protein